MKRSLSVLGLVALLFFAGCDNKNKPTGGTIKKHNNQSTQKNRDSNAPKPEKEQGDQPAPEEKPLLPKPFTLAATSATIDLDNGHSTTVKITSGNGKYKHHLSDSAKEKLTVRVEGELITIITTSETKLTAEVTITDITKEETLKLSVTVLPKSIPHHPLLGLVIEKNDFDKKSDSEKKGIIDKLIEETEKLSTLINKAKEYDKKKYTKQAGLFSEGQKNYGWRKKEYENHKGGEKLYDQHTLWDIYAEIYLYGVGYFTTEYVARLAEEFSEKYPNNQEIKKLAKGIFDSADYASQEGNDFVRGTNDQAIAPYNKIVDIVNSLVRGVEKKQ